MEENQSMDQLLKVKTRLYTLAVSHFLYLCVFLYQMRVLLFPTQSGALWEWPIKVPIAMDPSSTSHCSQHRGWTGPMQLLGLYITYGFTVLSKCDLHLFILFILWIISQVIEGLNVLKKLEKVPMCNERPKHDCKVINCGVFKI